ncbi:dicarboxylate/amino acid:cation symporter, partial [Xanthomonas fragariae]
MTLVSAWLRIPFWQRVAAGFFLGALAGWAVGPATDVWFGPLGELYVTLIRMIAIPLVFFAVINAISSLHGQKSVAALGGRTFLWFVITAALAVGVGLAVGTLMQPGAGHFSLSVDSAWKPRDVPSPIQVLLDVVPSNPFYALTGIGTKTNAAGETVLAAGRGSILPVIFFAALLGFAMVKLG